MSEGRNKLLSIGEFSRVSSLTVKTLRHYHERSLLVPARVDQDSGYRFYDSAAIERAQIIKSLKALDLSLDDIGEILRECSDDADAVVFLEQQRTKVAEKLRHFRTVQDSLDQIIESQKEAKRVMKSNDTQVIEKDIPTMLMAGIRVQGAFEECSQVYKRLGRAFGFGLAGTPGMLIYDEEYKEGDADFEPYFPIKASKRNKKVEEAISVREISGGRCLSLIHTGPYHRISPVYARLFQEARDRGLKVSLPTREVYVKGPGMIFKGNPERYITEVQFLVEPESSSTS